MRGRPTSVLLSLFLATTAVAETTLDDLYKHARENIEATIPAKEPARASFVHHASQGMLRTKPSDPIPDNINSAGLAEAIPSVIVRQDELIAYDGLSPVTDLFRDYGEIVYIIRINDNAISTANMHRVELGWKATSFATTIFAQQIDAALKKVPKKVLPLLITVPGLDAVFLGYPVEKPDKKVFVLIPVKMPEVSAQFMAKKHPAPEVFAALRMRLIQ